jgi:hypothetical protein
VSASLAVARDSGIGLHGFVDERSRLAIVDDRAVILRRQQRIGRDRDAARRKRSPKCDRERK